MSKQEDTIHIRGLRLSTRIGVPDAERAGWQSLAAEITLTPEHGFGSLGDDLSKTVDYQAVANDVRALAEAHPRKLIETLANEIAEMLLANFPLDRVTVELRKFILPDCDHVAVKVTRP